MYWSAAFRSATNDPHDEHHRLERLGPLGGYPRGISHAKDRGKYKAEQEFEDGLLVVKDASEKQYSVAGARIDSVANEEFEDFCLTVFDSPYSGEVVHVGAMDFCSPVR